MISYWAIAAILFFHWLFDFVFQKDEDAINKSSSNKHLLNHTTVYSALWWIPLLILGWSIKPILIFVGVTFVLHTITDYFTSRLNSRLYKENKRHLFFVALGFDQLLHYAQLFITYILLW